MMRMSDVNKVWKAFQTLKAILTHPSRAESFSECDHSYSEADTALCEIYRGIPEERIFTTWCLRAFTDTARSDRQGSLEIAEIRLRRITAPVYLEAGLRALHGS